MIKIGIIGTGRITGRFMEAVERVQAQEQAAVQVTCVYNPRQESAARFAEQYGLPFYTDDLNIFWEKIDAVYIASPHETHAGYAAEALERRVHVLCEKPLSFGREEAERLFASAKKKNLVLMEAIKTAYCPGFQALLETAKSGVIGTIRDVEAAFTRLTPTNLREMTNEVYGGSLTELGSYALLPIIKLLGGDYRSIQFQSIPGANGVDVYTKVMLSYEHGMGTAKTGLGVKSEGQLLISGTKGYILAESPWWLTQKFEVRFEDPNRREQHVFPFEGGGLQYELAAFAERIGQIGQIGKGQADEDVDGNAGENTAESVGVLTSQESNADALTPQESIALASVMETFLGQRKCMRAEDAKRETESEAEKDLEQVRIWAHRGCSMAYPENTLEAFEAAAQLPGITGIELDVQLTRDGEVVVFHDENVARVTDGGDKNVAEYTLRELKELKIPDDSEAGYTTIPTLREVLELLQPYCAQNGLLINIELKTGRIRYEGIEEKTIQLVQAYGLEPYIVYSSFLPDSLQVVKSLCPDAVTGMLASSLETAINEGKKVGADALHPWIGGLDIVIPEELRGMPVRAWNGEEPFFRDGRVLKQKDLREYAAFGVTDIITNVPERYLEEQGNF